MIATGSDAEVAAPRSTAGADLEGRSADVASKILTQLNEGGYLQPFEDGRKRFTAVELVADELRQERLLTLREQVRAQGAFDVLDGLAEDMNG
jgi:hypothetical protein